MKPCTIVVENRGRSIAHSAFRGAHFVTVLYVEVRDDETGKVLNTHVAHSFDKDKITFKVFYDDEQKLKFLYEELAK